MRNFRKYDFWQDSMNLVKLIYQLTNTFPKNDALVNQMQRAVVSIPSNIAEGSSRVSSIEFARYLEISIGSAFELETQLELSYMLKYINDNGYNNLIKDIQSIEKRIYILIQKLRTK
jgi:four helix bundle protein